VILPLLLGRMARAADVVAFVGATVHPASGPPIPDGVVVIDGPTITAVGPRRAVSIPDGADVHDLSGRHLIPGLVDTHSHIGGGRLHEGLGPVQPGISAIDAIDPTHVSVDRALAGGVTTVNVMPGSGKLMGGQTAYLKLRDSAIIDDLLLCWPATGGLPPGATDATPARRAQVCGGMKMANGTNPQGKGSDPKSRMGAAFLQREAFLSAQERVRALDSRDAAAEAPRRRKRDAPEPLTAALKADALAQILRGDRRVHFHTHRADDVVTALRLGEEFGFQPVLHHVSEAWKVADLLGEAEAWVSLIIVDSPGGKEEALEITAASAAALHDKGALVAFHTDDPITDSRLFLRMAGMAVRDGLDPDVALRGLTLHPARMLDLDARVGSIEPGKDADLVVLSGPPLSTWTHVEQTWVEGALRFDRANPDHHRHATGGDSPTAPTLEATP